MVCLLGFAGIANADCPSTMNAEQLVECITIEGSGANYQSWKKKYDQLADASVESESQSVVSMNTSEIDVAKVMPAAGPVTE